MPRWIQYFIYPLMIAVGLVAMYTLLNAGNPDSLLRPFFPDPRTDVTIAMISSVIVFIMGFFVFYARDREGFQHMLQLNQDRIRDLRRQGHSDDEIAQSLLGAMGMVRGYRYNMARKKLIAYLADFR